MKDTFYRQCFITNGKRHDVVWLPERFASEGKTIKIRDGGDWEDGWIVQKVSTIRLSDEEVRKNGRDHAHQREASDI